MSEENNEIERLAEEQADDVAQALRDAEAAKMAAELMDEEGESEPDFDPLAQVEDMPEEMQQAALKQLGDVFETEEGASALAHDAINQFEELVKEHGHEDFELKEIKKTNGVKRLTPIIQKYAPAALGLLGQYKDEVMAAIWVGSLAYSSVKQVKALKVRDAKLNQADEAVNKAEEQAQEAA